MPESKSLAKSNKTRLIQSKDDENNSFTIPVPIAGVANEVDAIMLDGAGDDVASLWLQVVHIRSERK